MIGYSCSHCRGFRQEPPVVPATQCFVGAYEIIERHTNGKLRPEPTHRLCVHKAFACQMSIPHSPVEIRSFHVRCVDRLAWQLFQPAFNTLCQAENYLCLYFHYTAVLSGLVNSGVIQAFVNNLFRLTRTTSPTSWFRLNQFMKQLFQPISIMWQFVGCKQGELLCS